MIGPVHDFGHVVLIFRARTSFDTDRIETVQTEDLYRTFDAQMVQFIGDVQVDDIFLHIEESPIRDQMEHFLVPTSVRLFSRRPSTFASAKYSLYWGRPMSSSHSARENRPFGGECPEESIDLLCTQCVSRMFASVCRVQRPFKHSWSFLRCNGLRMPIFFENEQKSWGSWSIFGLTFSSSWGEAWSSCKPFLKCLRHSPAYWPRPMP